MPDDLTSLPQCEQVARGLELMSLLTPEPDERRSMAASSKKLDDMKVGEDWNIIVKHSFIEVVIPAFEGRRRRCMSESALPLFEKMEQPWKSLACDRLQDMSDASTNTSIEAEDLDANCRTQEEVSWSSQDGDSEPEAQAAVISIAQAQAAPYQYVESWWVPMGYDSNQPVASAHFEQAPTGFEQGYDQAGRGYEQPAMVFDTSVPSFVPMRWADQTMGTVECHGADADSHPQEWRTTVMIRNMPNNYTRNMLLELVDSMGFAGNYDFAYLPVDFQSQAGLGYAFINFRSVADANLCFERFEGFSNWTVPSEKVCTVTWSSPTQGLESHIERYKNSPVMHHSLPDEWKPVLLQNGMRVAFPPPSKPIKTPKVRAHPTAKTA